MAKFKLAMLILLMCLAVGVGLLVLTQREEPAKPEFNVFNLEAGGNLVKFNLQNLGEADAHNVSIKVNGTWRPFPPINITDVTEDYIQTGSSSGNPIMKLGTIFHGNFDCFARDGHYDYMVLHTLMRARALLWMGTESMMTHEYFWIRVTDEEGTRTLTDSEVSQMIDCFENPNMYPHAESTIDVLKKGEIKTVEIGLECLADSFEMVISCDEGVTLEETM